MTISVIGTGYVGLVTGAVLADFGHTVYCVDIDQNKIQSLKDSQIPFYEPGLEEIVRKNIQKKRLLFTTNYAEAIPNSEVVFICVGTPPKANGEADTTYVQAAVTETAKNLDHHTLIVIKSTAPIGVEEDLKKLIEGLTDKPFEFASNPEFLREGTAVADTINPDRIVIGVQSEKAAEQLLEVYKPFGGERLICDIRSAQMIKYAANSFLAMKISYANSIANLAEQVGADALVVLKGIGMDQRIGPRFLQPGIGYGGSCFPKDVAAFIETAHKYNQDFPILKAVQQINAAQIEHFLDKVEALTGGIKGKTLACLGLAFKPDTDDVRDSAAIKIIQRLVQAGATVQVYDPMATENAKKILQQTVTYATDPYQAADKADALLLLTEWNEFKAIDFKKLKKQMTAPVVIDGRNLYVDSNLLKQGFTYQGIGRK